MKKFFQNIFHHFHAPADTVPDSVLRHIFSSGNIALAFAQDVMSIHPACLDRRKLVESGVEVVPLLGLLHDLLRGQRGPGHIGLEAGGPVQGALVMLPLAPLVAVTQAAPDGEGHGDLLRHFQGDTLGQVGVVVIQFDGRHK